MSILDKILVTKISEIKLASKLISFEQLVRQASSMSMCRNFHKSLISHKLPPIIAEIKRASPSKGIIREDLDPVKTAKEYRDYGAACLSVLTDEQYFKGSLSFISAIRAETSDIPILRKDFIIDAYQIWQARVAGADAILLIVAALTKEKLEELYREAKKADLQVLIEAHTKDEIEVIVKLIDKLAKENTITDKLPMIGVNNRNLKTFEVSIETTKVLNDHLNDLLRHNNLFELTDSLIVVSESGIYSGCDICKLSKWGAKAFLVGESLVKEGNPGENLSILIKSATTELGR